MAGFNLSALAVRQRAVTLYFLLVAAVTGVWAFVDLGRAEDPAFTVKVMVVQASWPGATAEEMQDQVADKLERRIMEVAWLDRVETTTRPGQAILKVVFAEDTPSEKVEDLFYQVRKRAGDESVNLPAGVRGPFFDDDFSDVYFSLYAIKSPDLPLRQLTREAEEIRGHLRRVAGVKKVDLIGEREQRIFVEFDHDRLATLGLSAAQFRDALAGDNAVVPGGLIETAGPRVYLRPAADLASLDAIRDTAVATGEGRLVRVGDVADVRRGHAEPPSFIARSGGEEAVLLGVVMEAGFNGLDLAEELDAFEAEQRNHLAAGVAMEQVSNQANAIRLAVNEFELKFLVAVVVITLVGFLALGLRAGLVVALAVPLTLGITFLIMQLTGRNLDRITLGALILSLGLLVDDAIIAIEMMLVKLEEGFDRVAAAAQAWNITAGPMLAGTLVTVAGFIPIGFAESRVGEYAGNIFWILAFTLITSWVVAVVFTPYLGVKLLPKVEPHPGGADELYDTPTYQRLRRLVTWCVDHRLVVGGLTTLLMVAAILGMRFGVEQQFFPTSDRPELQVDVQLPQGSSLSATRAVADRVEEYLRQAEESEHVATYIGRGSPRFFLALDPELPDPAFAKLIVRTHGKEARQRLREKVQARIAAGDFADARVRAHPLLYGPPVPWPVTFRVMGPDVDELRGIAARVRQRIADHPNTTQAHAEWGERVSALRLTWDRQRLRLLGLTPEAVAGQVQAATDGVRATEVREDIRTVDLVTRADPATRPDLDRLGSLVIETGTGERLPLEQVADLEVVQEEPVLKRRNRTPTMEVHAELRGDVQPPDVTAEIDPTLDSIRADLPRGYRVEVGGAVEESGKARASIAGMFPVMIGVMVTLIMLSMRSFPGTIMTLLTAPLGLIGAVAGLLLADRPFGFVAMLGLIGLAGILMRNTLILAGQIQANQQSGMDDYNSVIEATLRRARPVILTALAAVLAFLPLTTSTFWGPLAVVLIGGVTVGTALTLLFLPALYALWFRAHPPAGA